MRPRFLVPFAPEYRKFPVFSQLAGNLASETSPLMTASSAKLPMNNLRAVGSD